VGSRGGESETEREREDPIDGGPAPEEQVRLWVVDRWLEVRFFGGQNRLPAWQGLSGSSCGVGLAPIGAENAGDALNGFERGRSGE
jgi:hypothetical protein